MTNFKKWWLFGACFSLFASAEQQSSSATYSNDEEEPTIYVGMQLGTKYTGERSYTNAQGSPCIGHTSSSTQVTLGIHGIFHNWFKAADRITVSFVGGHANSDTPLGISTSEASLDMSFLFKSSENESTRVYLGPIIGLVYGAAPIGGIAHVGYSGKGGLVCVVEKDNNGYVFGIEVAPVIRTPGAWYSSVGLSPDQIPQEIYANARELAFNQISRLLDNIHAAKSVEAAREIYDQATEDLSNNYLLKYTTKEQVSTTLREEFAKSNGAPGYLAPDPTAIVGLVSSGQAQDYLVASTVLNWLLANRDTVLRSNDAILQGQDAVYIKQELRALAGSVKPTLSTLADASHLITGQIAIGIEVKVYTCIPLPY